MSGGFTSTSDNSSSLVDIIKLYMDMDNEAMRMVSESYYRPSVITLTFIAIDQRYEEERLALIRRWIDNTLISKICSTWRPGYTNPPRHICVYSGADMLRKEDVKKITRELSERFPWVDIRTKWSRAYNNYTFTISVKRELRIAAQNASYQ